ncbi:uncharacterized protein L3040_002494 [Drepanopeziza brunnea f. sp. 'multigermtubi']|uniref:uncharacterized protein n=1 Tax=Drepanopeziza brunnea f. sp. 'multigermtubi' TaxID=698441 RepID=UPI002384AFE7|nr:hypothetical protein L3040_002494 [Drepanopeziza brunnea f. sp. 'multigermtubi']
MHTLGFDSQTNSDNNKSRLDHYQATIFQGERDQLSYGMQHGPEAAPGFVDAPQRDNLGLTLQPTTQSQDKPFRNRIRDILDGVDAMPGTKYHSSEPMALNLLLQSWEPKASAGASSTGKTTLVAAKNAKTGMPGSPWPTRKCRVTGLPKRLTLQDDCPGYSERKDERTWVKWCEADDRLPKRIDGYETGDSDLEWSELQAKRREQQKKRQR